MSDDERSWSGANAAIPLWTAASHAGDREAVLERDQVTRYAELRDRAGSIAAGLTMLGAEPGARVAIFLERGATAAAAYFGVLAAGAVAIIINERARPRQIEYVLGHADARVLLTSAEMLARQPRALETAATVVDVEALPDRAPATPAARDANDLAQLIYTSGSTGLPKGVMLTHGGLRAAVGAVVEYLGLREDDRIASLLPFSSVYGLNQLLCAVEKRATLLVDLSPAPQQLAAGLAERGVTVLAAVPPLWLQLLSAPAFTRAPIPSLRLMQNAGGHLPIGIVRGLRGAQPGAELFLQYGMTETFRSTFLSPADVDAHPDSMGRAIPGAEVLVVREDGTACHPGEVGELVHCGPTVALGYWGDDAGTARVFRAPPECCRSEGRWQRAVYSGDMVRRDEGGLLYFVSRRDRMIKTLGFRVGPDEVADALYASGEVAEVVVTGEPDAQRGERIVAHVVLRPGGTLAGLERFCRVELPRHMQPARYELREVIPRLISGKHDVAALRASAADAVPVAAQP